MLLPDDTGLRGARLLKQPSPLLSLQCFYGAHLAHHHAHLPRRWLPPRRSNGHCVSSATQERQESRSASRRAPKKSKLFVQSDGQNHLGSALTRQPNRPFPGPPSGQGPPLRVLPVGGLGEIGMNCMLVGVYDRYILIDAGLMFPDFTDLGMQKILPDTTFLAEWRDKIEAVIITHGHEDHIGALPWVVPALDPNTPVYGGAFTMQLVRRRMQEYSMFNERRFHNIKMGQRFQAGPFEVEAVRVTHSIPDCCGLILRSEHGNIVHTGDWKIEENPVDGQKFDRSVFEQIGREGATLLMSDSTNVLSPGRTNSEASVEDRIMRRVMGHQGKGRVISTQFASNIHRLAAIKKAADASGRKICFVGMSLTTYLEAAHAEGQAPFSPADLIPVNEIEQHDPNTILLVSTGSQAEPRSALNLASREASPLLRLNPTDLLLYSAKIIPGNDNKVMNMMNNASQLGVEIAMGPTEGLHTSGHAYRDELDEIIKLVKPQHFLPVHGEYAFLNTHAQLAHEAGIRHTSVIRNGQMLGVHHRRNGNEVSTTGASAKGMQLLGEVKLRMLYNDGNKGTGSAEEMCIDERTQLATEGIVIAAVDLIRGNSFADAGMNRPDSLKAQIRVTSRGMWVADGRLPQLLHKAADTTVKRMPSDATLVAVERAVANAMRRTCKEFNDRQPDVVVVAHEMDPREAAAARASVVRRSSMQDGPANQQQQHRQQQDANGALQQGVQQQSAQQRRQQGQPGSNEGSAGQRRGRGRPRKDDSSSSNDQPQQQALPQGERRRGRPRKDAQLHDSSGDQQPALAVREVPPEVVSQRKASNPRENPTDNTDLSYD